MSREKQIDIIRDLLVEFDEMGFVPSTTVPDHEAYAIKWRAEITKALENYFKQSEGEWIVDAWDNQKEEWVTIPYNKHLHADAYCSLCKNPALLDGAEYGVASNYCPNCGARMSGGKNE